MARLLEKAPADRFQSAADLVWALDQASEPRAAASPVVPERESNRWSAAARVALVVAPLALGVIGLAMWWTAARTLIDSQAAPARFTWTLPRGTTLFSAPAVSPDGRRICWAGFGDAGVPQLFVRELASLDAMPIPGTEGARHPFWSPDGQAIGFFAGGRLKRVAAAGGPPIVLADAPNPRGGAWSPSGTIVFAPDLRDTPLMRVSDRGGQVEPVTAIDPAQEEAAHRWPAFLPDGVHFLYSVLSLRDDRRGIYIGSLDDVSARPIDPLFASESGAVYVPAGNGRHGVLLSVGDGRIEVRPFDPAGRVLAGEARTIGIEAAGASPHHAALLSASADVLAYSAVRGPWGSRWASIARDGSDLRVLSERELGGFPRISPDGGRLARSIVDPLRANADIWVEDLQRGTRLRLTTAADFDVVPVWAPDGREVAYRSGTLHEATIGVAAADGTGVRRTLACPESPCEPSDWSPDGRLVVTVRGRDVWTVPVEPGARPQPLLAEAFTERDARISPDGRWLAYVSDESGRPEVSIRSLAGPERRFVVSREAGDQPVWRHDGTELFFAAAAGQLYSVTVRPDTKSGLSFGAATQLDVPPLGERHWGTIYAVSADGRRVYFPHAGDDSGPHEFGVVMNWSARLK